MIIQDERFPFQVLLEDKDYGNRRDMWRWCKATWGSALYENAIWSYSDEPHGYVFKFQREVERNFFILKWSV